MHTQTNLYRTYMCMYMASHTDQHRRTYVRTGLTFVHMQKSPSLRKIEMEFKKKVRHTVLIRSRAGPEKHTNQQTTCTWLALFTLYSSIFPSLFLSKSPISLAFPTFDASPKHPISLVQFPNALPLHTPWQYTPQSKRCSGELFLLTHPDGWTPGHQG